MTDEQHSRTAEAADMERKVEKFYSSGIRADGEPVDDYDELEHLKQQFLQSIPYRPVQWLLEGFPTGFFVGYYWVGLISGIVIGVLFGGVLI